MTAPRSSCPGPAGAPSFHSPRQDQRTVDSASPLTIIEDALEAIAAEAAHRGLDLQVQNDIPEHDALAASANGLVHAVRAMLRHAIETAQPGRVAIEATVMDSPEGDRAALQFDIQYVMNAEQVRRLEELVNAVCARDCTVTRSDTSTSSICSFDGLTACKAPCSCVSEGDGSASGSLSIAQQPGGRVGLTLLIDAPRIAPACVEP